MMLFLSVEQMWIYKRQGKRSQMNPKKYEVPGDEQEMTSVNSITLFSFWINSAHWNLISDEFYILWSQQWWIEPTKKCFKHFDWTLCLSCFFCWETCRFTHQTLGSAPVELTSELCTSLCRMLFVDFSGRNSVLVLFCTPSLLPSLPLSVNHLHALIVS